MSRTLARSQDPRTTGHALAATMQRAAAALSAVPERFVAADGDALASAFGPPAPPAGTDDILTMMTLVMLQAAQAADDDLRATLEEVHDAVEEKRRWRAVHAALQGVRARDVRPASPGERPALEAGDLEAALRQAQERLDSLSELGELESLRLQLAIDRLQKLMSTLSNLLKKLSDTAQSITQNLK